MGTHAKIYLKLRREDKNTTRYSKLGQYHIGNANYLCIYCGSDGHAYGLGRYLAKYKTYKDIIAMMDNGDLCKPNEPYTNYSFNVWDSCKSSTEDYIDESDTDVLYMFDDVTSCWKIFSTTDGKWLNLSLVI